MTKARKRVEISDRIKDLNISEKIAFAIRREERRGVSGSQQSGGGLGSGGSSGIDGTQFVRRSGDSMLGALAFEPKIVTIDGGVIDINPDAERAEAGSYSSNLIVINEGFASTDELDTIDKATNSGQIAFVQGIIGQTITLTSADNIDPIGGSFDLIDDSTILIKWQTTAGKWQQLTSGTTGTMNNPSTTDLDMGGFSIKNKKSQTYLKVTNASIPTPSTDQKTVYYSSDIDEMAAKDDAGAVVSLESGAGGSGANIFLSNLSVGNTDINTDLRPDADDTHDLGTGFPLRSWKHLRINMIRFPNIESNPTNFHAIYRDSLDAISINVPILENITLRYGGITQHIFTPTSFQTDNIILQNIFHLNNNGPFGGFNGDMWNDNGSVHIFSGGADFAIDGLARGDLSNLTSPTLINADLDPALSNTRDLGDGTHVWKDVFLQQLRLQEGAVAPSNAPIITRVSNSMHLNVGTGQKIFFDFNGAIEWDLSSSTFSGENIILNGALALNDSSTDPSFNGEFRRNGADVKVFTGGSLVNLSTLGGGGEFEDDVFKVVSQFDNSRKVALNVGGVSSSTTRTWVVQNASGVVALLDGGITQISNNDWQFNGINLDIGNSSSDRLSILSRIDTDFIPSTSGKDLGSSSNEWQNVYADEIRSTDRIRAAGSSEIGFLVENGTGAIGSEGTVQLPYTNSAPGSDAAADGLFGAFQGAIGFQKAGSGGILYLRDNTGNWSVVATANVF